MTQLRRDTGALSNYFDRVLHGVGHRGSSFTDLDAITHDGRTGRFLVQEFKQPSEKLSPGQRRLLEGLAALWPRFTVWYVQRWSDGQIAWADMRAQESIDVLSEAEYRRRFEDWWCERYCLREEDRRYGVDSAEPQEVAR